MEDEIFGEVSPHCPSDDDLLVGGFDAWDEDRFTFEDSVRFEEDSLCSWSSEQDSLINNWRGWRRPNLQASVYANAPKTTTTDGKPPSLTELTARCIATHIPFELVEHVYPPVPEQLQLQIAYWSFPDNEEDIRLYSCLANGNSEEFQRGDHLYRCRAVREPLQIGFHLSACVLPPPNVLTSTRVQFNVAVSFDRGRITSCNCTCGSAAYWCSHIVAVCLHRINKPDKVCLRAPVSESLSRLHREQLQKFAQYLISELPQQILPTAQRLLDELLTRQPSAINSVCGAPDPTAGASISDHTSWYLDQKNLHDNIKKILVKFCVPAPIVFSDVNYLTTTAPPAAAEWSSLLRPLRGREPEGMWNLLSIVREMFKRNDRNAVPLLEIITDECLACEQILLWWFNTTVALHSGSGGGRHASASNNTHASQYACSSLCDEIVSLWRLAALNPGIAPDERVLLEGRFIGWQQKIIDTVTKPRNNVLVGNHSHQVFPGFNPAIQACYLDWHDYPLPGITYSDENNPWYHCPFTSFLNAEATINQVITSPAVMNCHSQPAHFGAYHRRLLEFYARRREHKQIGSRSGYRSSVSSEGFCENDADADLPPHSGVAGNEHEDRENVEDNHENRASDSISSCEIAAAVHVSQTKTREKVKERKKDSDANRKIRSFTANEHSQSSEESDMGVFTNEKFDDKKNKKNTGNNSAAAAEVFEQTSSVQSAPKKSNVTQSKGKRDHNNEAAPKQEHAGSQKDTDSSRRPSNDSLASNSDSQQSGDEYNVYYFKNEGNAEADSLPRAEKEKKEKHDKIRPLVDPWEILFARAEGLHAHGHGLEACTLAVRLARELLADPPNLLIDLPQPSAKTKRRKVHPASHQISCLASATLAKCAFLCAVLSEVPDHHHLALRVGLFGLEMARPPASTKPLEVKLVNQESELVNLIKRIPLGAQELATVREKAEQLRDGKLRSRGEALLPMMLASFIFDALENMPGLRETRKHANDLRKSGDETLAFESAVAALGLKANVSESDHPLLCEGTRRQRGDLAITLLVHYKDDPIKLAKIMEKLLDREVHCLIKTPLSGWYYSTSSYHKAIPSKRLTCEEDIDPAIAGYSVHPCDSVGQDQACALPSRPLSGTSAELEQGITSMALNPTPTSHARGKDNQRFKGKRIYPALPNQPSEASAHFMFELAKTVLSKAGGSSSISLFTQASTNQQHHGPHRALHFCAFQIGLYALGLHNCVSPNWLSRTYSSHVSWITGQAMEIGTMAISFLIDTWEGHLTPPEAASIADRASRGCDKNMVRAAAELALSCLPHAHALNPNEIQRAIVQCKEQSEAMLEHSCLTVENAAKGGGVYPEVLFQVAKCWYDLYVRNCPGGEQVSDIEAPRDPVAFHLSLDPSMSVLTLMEPQEVQQHPPLPTQVPHTISSSMPMIPQAPPIVPVPYAVAPYSFTVHSFHTIPPPPLGLYLPPPQYQYQSPQPGPMPQQYFVQGNSQTPMRHVAYPITTVQQVGPNQNQIKIVQPPNVAVTSTVNVGLPQPGPALPVSVNQPVSAVVPVRPSQPQVNRQGQGQYTPAQFRCLLSAYRVGMLALETLARRVHDDRPQAKYARNPPYEEDIKWLLRVANKLGSQYLHQFCVCVVNSIVSPFILHDVALEAAYYLARNNPTLILQHLRSALTPLVQKCQQMYIQCLHQKLYHLTNSDYEDFVSVVCSARAAFQITPDGPNHFKDWLQSIRRSKSCKKELWAQINTALQGNNN